MDKSISDLGPHVQNFIIKEILITKSGYLRPYHSFKDSNSALYSFFYSEPKNHDGWALKDLAQLLLLLVQRKALIPVTFKGALSGKPLFIFDNEYDNLSDDESHQLLRFDFSEAAKALEN